MWSNDFDNRPHHRNGIPSQGWPHSPFQMATRLLHMFSHSHTVSSHSLQSSPSSCDFGRCRSHEHRPCLSILCSMIGSWVLSGITSSRRLRSASSSLLAVPRTRTNYGDHGFAVHGPRVWNSLPDELRSPDITLTTFRNKLKTLLFNV